MTVAVILAGGLGTRLRTVVSDRPKPMALVEGEPFLKHLMDYWINQGVTEFVLSIGYLGNVIKDYFGTTYQGCKISYSLEEEPLGTGGGLLRALRHVDHEVPFLLLNGDTFFEVDLAEFLRFHEMAHSVCSFSLFEATEANRYMVIDVDEAGEIKSLTSRKGLEGQPANGGVYLLNASAFARHYDLERTEKLSLEDDIFPKLLSSGEKLFGFNFPGRFLDIGVPQDYARAGSVLALGG